MRTTSVAWGGTAAIAASGRRFHLLALIGRGSYGDVYLAEQRSGAGFRRKVALKLLNDDVVKMRGAARRMRDEARILGLLSHRHIVAVHDLIRVDDRWAILMDYIPGADLERIVEALAAEGTRFPVSAALEVGAAVFDALDFAGSADDGNGGRLAVIHRDIKPSNVRLTADGDVKVLDFGVARFSHECRETETRTTAWIGTERYMSPERLLREGETVAGDVYAAAATVVELILGEPIGRSPITAEAHADFVNGALYRVRERIEADPYVVNRVLTALARALRADPTRRPEAGALCRELEALARRVPGPSLKEFARTFVPRVEGLLGRDAEPVNGVLVVGTSIEGQSSRGPEDGATIDRGNLDAEAVFFTDPPALRRRSVVWPILGAGAVGVLAAGALAVIGQPWEWIPQIPMPELSAMLGALPGTVALTQGPLGEDPPPSEAAPAPVEWATVGFEDGALLSVTCGSVTASGRGAVRLQDFPAGTCRVEAEWLHDQLSAEVRIEKPQDVRCEAWDGRFWCS